MRETETHWFKDAVFYEVYVRGFQDSSQDGNGDLIGLIDRLDYLQDLGVDCLWLTPIYASPLRDDGYDISDFRAIDPAIGSVATFERLTEAAHSRGIRVIADLVINHTSEKHPWFQQARRDPMSRYREYYVWSKDDRKYADARVLVAENKETNWTWDPASRQYYFHRFFCHQPDLNYDNPAVRKEMLRIMEFWLDLGLDGFRVDAAPYLFQRDGTSCEDLPETHEFLKEMRRFVDQQYPGTLLLAEVNQWPSKLVNYFGDGDEFHMAFNFPLMPRMYMALRREDCRPIIDIISNMPAIPNDCQWMNFLRNHDELSLEMVTDAERDYMYAEYAKDPRMRLNKGIRRRLAPLLDNGRRQIELLYSMLLTLPGSPVIYYGDEIGMGDNIYLGGRNGVRTPMQWNGDRNAGFSRADPSRLYQPLITDPIYHYQAINVEAQSRSSASLLNWLRRVIQVRKRHPAFSRGSLRFVQCSNPHVVAYTREYDGETVLVVNNLSRFSQSVRLGLSDYAGHTPIELLGGQRFSRIGESPYLVTPSPHSSFWFSLATESNRPSGTRNGSDPRRTSAEWRNAK